MDFLLFVQILLPFTLFFGKNESQDLLEIPTANQQNITTELLENGNYTRNKAADNERRQALINEVSRENITESQRGELRVNETNNEDSKVIQNKQENSNITDNIDEVSQITGNNRENSTVNENNKEVSNVTENDIQNKQENSNITDNIDEYSQITGNNRENSTVNENNKENSNVTENENENAMVTENEKIHLNVPKTNNENVMVSVNKKDDSRVSENATNLALNIPVNNLITTISGTDIATKQNGKNIIYMVNASISTKVLPDDKTITGEGNKSNSDINSKNKQNTGNIVYLVNAKIWSEMAPNVVNNNGTKDDHPKSSNNINNMKQLQNIRGTNGSEKPYSENNRVRGSTNPSSTYVTSDANSYIRRYVFYGDNTTDKEVKKSDYRKNSIKPRSLGFQGAKRITNVFRNNETSPRSLSNGNDANDFRFINNNRFNKMKFSGKVNPSMKQINNQHIQLENPTQISKIVANDVKSIRDGAIAENSRQSVSSPVQYISPPQNVNNPSIIPTDVNNGSPNGYFQNGSGHPVTTTVIRPDNQVERRQGKPTVQDNQQDKRNERLPMEATYPNRNTIGGQNIEVERSVNPSMAQDNINGNNNANVLPNPRDSVTPISREGNPVYNLKNPLLSHENGNLATVPNTPERNFVREQENQIERPINPPFLQDGNNGKLADKARYPERNTVARDINQVGNPINPSVTQDNSNVVRNDNSANNAGKNMNPTVNQDLGNINGNRNETNLNKETNPVVNAQNNHVESPINPSHSQDNNNGNRNGNIPDVKNSVNNTNARNDNQVIDTNNSSIAQDNVENPANEINAIGSRHGSFVDNPNHSETNPIGRAVDSEEISNNPLTHNMNVDKETRDGNNQGTELRPVSEQHVTQLESPNNSSQLSRGDDNGSRDANSEETSNDPEDNIRGRHGYRVENPNYHQPVLPAAPVHQPYDFGDDNLMDDFRRYKANLNDRFGIKFEYPVREQHPHDPNIHHSHNDHHNDHGRRY